MIRIAFLGSDSTHTEAFGRLMNTEGAPFFGRARVTSIYGHDLAQTETKARALQIDKVAGSVDDALDGCDLAMVIGRFGDAHFLPAMAAVARQTPTFVDKPFTVDAAEARKLAEAAAQRRVPLMSASPLRFAAELERMRTTAAGGWRAIECSAPANCTDLGSDPRLNTPFFYGIHALEMLLDLAGPGVQAVRHCFGRAVITVQCEFAGDRTAVLTLVQDAAEFYRVTVCTERAEESAAINLDGSYYRNELELILGGPQKWADRVPVSSSVKAIEILEMVAHGRSGEFQ
jgi:predicted dehydrogenase